ncbi:hypothetical protein FK088_21700 [Salmonella enterica]|nr:hypothetical protein [Salmonella enterica]EBI1926112.1 hypothetical protein [Salmonella enterica]
MEQKKHTPGPWYAVPNSSFIDIATAPGCYGGVTIADTCSSGHIFDNGDCINGETTVANAKLIAAAPELLEACLSVRSHLFAAGYEPEADSTDPNKLLLAQLINVIDKALN